MNKTNAPNYKSPSELLSETENAAQSNPNDNKINTETGITETRHKTSSKPSKEFLKNADWYAIARKLRQSNRQLVEKIMNLETSIKDYEGRLETQQRRCRSADHLIEQQTQELNNSQEEITHIYNELQNVNQEYQSQQIFIENLSQDLQSSQQQIARLERECSLLQENYNQQKNRLLEAEKQNRELQVRLQRQQRYTLQFKTALDQCLEAPNQENINQVLEKQIAVKVKQIKPWSNYQEETAKTDVNSNLHRKLLGTQSTEMSEINFENLPEIITNNPILSQDLLSENLSNSGDNNLENINLTRDKISSTKSNIIENKSTIKNEEENLDLNLPSWEQQEFNPLNQIMSSNPPSLLVEKPNSEQKNKKKNLLELPKLPRLLN